MTLENLRETAKEFKYLSAEDKHDFIVEFYDWLRCQWGWRSFLYEHRRDNTNRMTSKNYISQYIEINESQINIDLVDKNTIKVWFSVTDSKYGYRLMSYFTFNDLETLSINNQYKPGLNDFKNILMIMNKSRRIVEENEYVLIHKLMDSGIGVHIERNNFHITTPNYDGEYLPLIEELEYNQNIVKGGINYFEDYFADWLYSRKNWKRKVWNLIGAEEEISEENNFIVTVTDFLGEEVSLEVFIKGVTYKTRYFKLDELE